MGAGRCRNVVQPAK